MRLATVATRHAELENRLPLVAWLKSRVQRTLHEAGSNLQPTLGEFDLTPSPHRR